MTIRPRPAPILVLRCLLSVARCCAEGRGSAALAGYISVTISQTVYTAGTQAASLSGTGGSTSGGGGACTPAGANQTVTICTPANNATVSSPVQVSAAATDTNPVKYLQIYVDGVKVYEVLAGSLNTSLAMIAGTHRLTVQAADSTGLIFKTTIYVTVQ